MAPLGHRAVVAHENALETMVVTCGFMPPRDLDDLLRPEHHALVGGRRTSALEKRTAGRKDADRQRGNDEGCVYLVGFAVTLIGHSNAFLRESDPSYASH